MAFYRDADHLTIYCTPREQVYDVAIGSKCTGNLIEIFEYTT